MADNIKGKVVLLPREWNSPDEPPENFECDSILKLKGNQYCIGYFYDGHWFMSNTQTEEHWQDFKVNDQVIGWCHLVSQ